MYKHDSMITVVHFLSLQEILGKWGNLHMYFQIEY